MSALAEIIVIAFALSLFGFTAVVFMKPAIAERFLTAFANSARAHYTEHVVRLLIGASLFILSPTMWRPNIFWFIGWALVVPSVVLIILP